MSTERIEIIANGIVVNEDFVNYRVVHEDGSTGEANLSIEDGRHILPIIGDDSIPLHSKIAELFFEPHSETSVQRQGVGSRVLEFIIKDAQTRRIKLIYAQPMTTSAEHFFAKHKFKGDSSLRYIIIS